ncbi:anthrone oxygenase family protein [Pedobacter africanus]|nr:anthrone oxygenase family protein [Pedobacter africanus]
MTIFVLILTAVAMALIAGLFYAYSCSVNPGLGKLSDEVYILAMQSINRAILNPVFFASFMGTLLLLPLSTWLLYRSGGASTVFYFLFAATIIYAVGTFGVTMVKNVPLNEALDKFNVRSASLEEIAKQRQLFQIPWNNFNNIRTIASIVSLVLVIIACINVSTGQNQNG